MKLYRLFREKRVVSGVISFKQEDEENPFSMKVNLTALTKRMLPIFTGPIKELTLQMPETESCEVDYDPMDSLCVSLNKSIYLLTGDPY